MQIIIDIPESEIPKRQDIIEIPLHFIDGKVCEAGGYRFDVLPKGHGRIGDLSKIYDRLNDAQIEGTVEYKGLGEAKQIICDAPTIIEADKESEVRNDKGI